MHRNQSGFKRKTGFGPATSTLARWSSTPELLSHVSAIIQKIRPLEKLFFSCNDVFIHQSDDENTFSEVRNDKQGILNWKLSLNRSLIMSYYLQLANLSYSWPDSSVLLFDDLNLTLDNGWVSFAGANGSGKTLFIRHLAAKAVEKWGADKVAFLKQEYSPEEAECLTAELRNLRDDEKGALVSDLYRLGSSPLSFVTAAGLSPGELRKLDLLLSLRAQPALLIMDEPTNHLDITSVMAFESLLSSSDLTLVLVSHDAKLRQTLCTRTVSVERKGNTGSVRLI